MLSNDQINQILEDYNLYIIKHVYKRIRGSGNKLFYFPAEEIVQEVRIKLWTNLRDKFDPDKGDIHTFVVSFLPFTIRGVLSEIKKSLKYTGNQDPGKQRGRRSEFRKIQKRAVSIDNPGEDLFAHIVSEASDAMFGFDEDVIVEEIKNRLKPNSFKIFYLIFIKDLTQAEVARDLGKSSGAVSKQMKNNILPVVKEVLLNFGYLEN